MSDAKERPILFSGPMVRAILDGSKTQTRRMVKVPRVQKIGPGDSDTPDDWGYWAEGPGFAGWMTLARDVYEIVGNNSDRASIPCPYGAPGDRLWVRETWGPLAGGVTYQANVGVRAPDGNRWRPSIHMPRWASRITLEVTSVRVQRLHDISEEDAMAEGCRDTRVAVVADERIPEGSMFLSSGRVGVVRGALDRGEDARALTIGQTARGNFTSLWASINGAQSWDENPWVWVVGFKRLP